jgi:PKD repeat protein
MRRAFWIVTLFLLFCIDPRAATNIVAAPLTPVADFSVTPTSWDAPATVSFTDKSIGNVTGWLWSFGDGTLSTLKNPVHVYDKPGAYTVALTVTSADGTATKEQLDSVTVEEHVPVGDEYLVRLDPTAHLKFGLYYPLTYKFKLPLGSHDFSAQYRYWEGTWRNLPEKGSAEIFNGVDAVRFDYVNGFAYVSAKFNPSYDRLYLRIVDAAGQPVAVDFDSIPKFYDDRRAAVTITLDDWSQTLDSYYRGAIDYLLAYNLYFTAAVVVSEAPWASLQEMLDKAGDHLELASHSNHHACTQADYLTYGYQSEVAGSKDSLGSNLTYPYRPYVPVYVPPCGYVDATLQSSITSAGYLVGRGVSNWFPDGSQFVKWNSQQGRYGIAAVAYDDDANIDDINLLKQANAAFDEVMAKGMIYSLMDHPWVGFWHDNSYLLQHLDYVKGRSDVWYVPFGQLYQYHYLQETRGELSIQHLGKPPIAADFSADLSSGTAPLSVGFTDASTGGAKGWLWDFGDGQTDTGRNPVHVYANAGTYQVTLTVTGSAGVNSRSRAGFVTVIPAAPVAEFKAATTSGGPPLTVAFSDTSVGVVTGWQWDFGDSGQSSLQNPVHVYAGAGTYSVKLDVTGPGGSNSRTHANYITVIPVAPAAVSISAPSQNASYGAPADVAITANAIAGTGATVSRVEFFQGSTLIGTSTSAPYGFTWTGVAAGSYTLTARVTDSAGATAISAPVVVNVTSKVLPPQWQSSDIGKVVLAGSTQYLNGSFAQLGAGGDIWNLADAFHYSYLQLNGDGQIVARVASLQKTDSWAKSGVMIRETLTEGSPHALMSITVDNGAAFQRRLAQSSPSYHTTGPYVNAPYWVKLVRTGDSFSGYVSPDGATWSLVGTDSIHMTNPVYIGLALTSHNTSALCASTVDGVTITGVATSSAAVGITSPVSGASFAAPATVAMTATATPGTGATVSKVDFFAGSIKIGTATAAPYNVTWSSVPDGSYSVTATMTDSLGATVTSSPVVVTVTPPSVPAPWATQDVGSVGQAGTAACFNGTFTLQGAGADIWGTADGFRFVYQLLGGDGQIIARVGSQQNTNQWAKSGVMIRGTLNADSVHAMIDLTPVNGAEFSRRTATGGATTVTGIYNIAAPYWVKLSRSGNTFTGSLSPDGVNWSQAGSSTINMPVQVYVGMVTTSHDDRTLGTSTLDNVSVTQGSLIAPSVAITAPAAGASYKAPAVITVAAAASAGTGAVVSAVDFYAGSTLIGTATASPYSVNWDNAAAGSYSLSAKVRDSLGGTATSAPVPITVSSADLPAPWSTQDIGSVGQTGSASALNGTFTISGSGLDIWGSADGFRFVYKPMTGDGQIVARVASLQNTSPWAKAGVMIRQSLTADSIHAMMDVTPGNGAEFSRRTATGGFTNVTAQYSVAAPYWVKLVRSGNSFTGYISADGVSWTTVQSDTIAMPSAVYVGMVITSHDSALGTTVMDNVR